MLDEVYSHADILHLNIIIILLISLRLFILYFDLKSFRNICPRLGILNEKTLLPSLFVKQKSPKRIMSIPIRISYCSSSVPHCFGRVKILGCISRVFLVFRENYAIGYYGLG